MTREPRPSARGRREEATSPKCCLIRKANLGMVEGSGGQRRSPDRAFGEESSWEYEPAAPRAKKDGARDGEGAFHGGGPYLLTQIAAAAGKTVRSVAAEMI